MRVEKFYAQCRQYVKSCIGFSRAEKTKIFIYLKFSTRNLKLWL